jgi:hypothetical protein
MQDFSAKRRLPGTVHQAPCEKTMKPDTCQNTKWTWLQMAHGPKHEAIELWRLRQKMLKLRQQIPLSKSRRKGRQGPTCRRVEVLEDTRSRELGWSGPRSAGLAHPHGGSPPPLTYYPLGLFIATTWRLTRHTIHHSPVRSREARGTPFQRGGSC